MIRRGLLMLAVTAGMALAITTWANPTDADESAQINVAAGTYHAVGKTPDGKAYEGDVAVEPLGQVKAVLWRLAGGGGAYKGIGLESGSVFGVAYGGAKPFGLVVYKVDGGKLDGRWSLAAENGTALGREKLQGPAGLEGSFQIVDGQNPGGSAYNGRVEIKHTGKTYTLQWFTPEASAFGTGILVDDVLVVAYGQDPGFGVVAYQQQGDHLHGIWSPAPSQETGIEDLTPQKTP